MIIIRILYGWILIIWHLKVKIEFLEIMRIQELSLNFSCSLLADLKLADIGSTNENSATLDDTACNLRIQKQHQILISSPLR